MIAAQIGSGSPQARAAMTETTIASVVRDPLAMSSHWMNRALLKNTFGKRGAMLRLTVRIPFQGLESTAASSGTSDSCSIICRMAHLLAVCVGIGCRCFRIPLPGPPAIMGAAMAVAMASGYTLTDYLLRRQSNTSLSVAEFFADHPDANSRAALDREGIA